MLDKSQRPAKQALVGRSRFGTMTAFTLVSKSFVQALRVLTADTTGALYPVPMAGQDHGLLFPQPGYLDGFLAHQGGWDEVALVGGPLIIIAVLLWIANRRVAAKLADQRAEDRPPT